MKKSIAILILGIATFIVAAIVESNVVGYTSLSILAFGFISLSYSTWCMFLTMPPINLNSYNAINLSNMDVELMEMQSKFLRQMDYHKFQKSLPHFYPSDCDIGLC